MDQVDVDRELVAHGYSNAISGLVGSIQNYLVYTNSVLFIQKGADDRVAGYVSHCHGCSYDGRPLWSLDIYQFVLSVH